MFQKILKQTLINFSFESSIFLMSLSKFSCENWRAKKCSVSINDLLLRKTEDFSMKTNLFYTKFLKRKVAIKKIDFSG